MSKNIHQFREIVVIYYSVRIELAQGYLLSNFGLPMLSVRFLFPEENTGRILQSIFIDTDKIRKQTRNVKKVVLSQLFSFLWLNEQNELVICADITKRNHCCSWG
jgi:hypothetical protein